MIYVMHVQAEGLAPYKFVEVDFREVNLVPCIKYLRQSLFSMLMQMLCDLSLRSACGCDLQVTKKKAMLIASKEVLLSKLGPEKPEIDPGKVTTPKCHTLIA